MARSLNGNGKIVGWEWQNRWMGMARSLDENDKIVGGVCQDRGMGMIRIMGRERQDRGMYHGNGKVLGFDRQDRGIEKARS